MSGEDGWWAMFFASIVFPRPCAPTRITFSPRARKSRVRMRSRARRSSAVGHSQFQSASGLKRPRRARVSRLSTLRRCAVRRRRDVRAVHGAHAFAGWPRRCGRLRRCVEAEGRGLRQRRQGCSVRAASCRSDRIEVSQSDRVPGDRDADRGFRVALVGVAFRGCGHGAAQQGGASRGRVQRAKRPAPSVPLSSSRAALAFGAAPLNPVRRRSEQVDGPDGGAEAPGGVNVGLGCSAGFPDRGGRRRCKSVEDSQ